MQRVNDRAGAKEQQRFEKRVRGQMEHRRRRPAQADGHDHVTELRERRVSEDAFDVVLLDGDQRGEQRGEAADVGDDFQRRRVEQKENAAKHVNTGGHHRGGVDQGGDGRRAFHRVRQARRAAGIARICRPRRRKSEARQWWRQRRAQPDCPRASMRARQNSANRAIPKPSEFRAESRSRRGDW